MLAPGYVQTVTIYFEIVLALLACMLENESMSNQITPVETVSAPDNAPSHFREECIHCKTEFTLTPYKQRKHYYVCDDCVRQHAAIRRASRLSKDPTISSSMPTNKGKAAKPIFDASSESARAMAQAAQKAVAACDVEALKAKIADAEYNQDTVEANRLRSLLPMQKEPKTKKAKVEAAIAEQTNAKPTSYVPQNGEVEELERAIKCGMHTLLTGPTGCGKTHLAFHVAEKLGKPIMTIQGGAGATYERIIAKDTLTEQNGVTITKRQDGILPQAMKQGAILYLDEPNAIPNEVLFYLFSAMDDRRTITFDDGQKCKAAEGFVVIGAMNEGSGYSGTQNLNAAFRSRTENIIDMEYLPKSRETKMLVARTGIDPQVADKLTECARGLRTNLKARMIKTPIGTRALLACSKLIVNGATIKGALQNTIVNQAPSTSTERKSISDVIAAHFGKGNS
jgi:nitric oxide reductase NorQ protein